MPTIAEYINNIPEPNTARALYALFEALGPLLPADSIKQSSFNRRFTFEEFESPPVVVAKDTGGAPDYALTKALIAELHDDHATSKTAVDAIETLVEELHDDHATVVTELTAIGTTLANIKTIYDAHTHECPGSTYAASRCSTPDTGAAENSLVASAASAITDTSGGSVPATLTAAKPASGPGTLTAGKPTGTAGDENLLIFEDNIFEYHVLGTQTIVAPVISATGLNIGMDQTDNDGVEITQGILSNSRAAFVVGTDACYFKCTFTIPDVSGTDDCAVGFRKAEAYQANIDDYDEAACVNIISGAIKTETILNNGDTTTTDTTDTWADAASKTVAVYVDIAGAVTYTVDGTEPTTVAAFSFDSGEVIVPFFYFLHASDLAGAVTISSWECGLQ